MVQPAAGKKPISRGWGYLALAVLSGLAAWLALYQAQSLRIRDRQSAELTVMVRENMGQQADVAEFLDPSVGDTAMVVGVILAFVTAVLFVFWLSIRIRLRTAKVDAEAFREALKGAVPPAEPANGRVSQLEHLARLRADGLITAEEFDEERRRLS